MNTFKQYYSNVMNEMMGTPGEDRIPLVHRQAARDALNDVEQFKANPPLTAQEIQHNIQDLQNQLSIAWDNIGDKRTSLKSAITQKWKEIEALKHNPQHMQQVTDSVNAFITELSQHYVNR